MGIFSTIISKTGLFTLACSKLLLGREHWKGYSPYEEKFEKSALRFA